MILCPFFAHGQTYFYRDSTIWVWSKSAPSTFWRRIKGSVYEKRADWSNFLKYYPDSCKTILPLVEKVSKVQAKNIEKKIKSVIDIHDSTLIVPWHSILRDDPQPELFPKYLFSPWRTMHMCPMCNSHLFSIEIHVPFGLINEGLCNIDIHHYPYLLYCKECNKQIGVVEGEKFSYGTLLTESIPESMIGFWECKTWPHTYWSGYEDRIIMEITKEGFMSFWAEDVYYQPRYTYRPQALWINSKLKLLSSYYVMVNNDVMFTFNSDVILLNLIKKSTKSKLSVCDQYEVNLSPKTQNFYTPYSHKKFITRKGYEYTKIPTPYSVFPNIHIGEFPNNLNTSDPLFWDRVEIAINLDNNELPKDQKERLDSLHIPVYHLPICGSYERFDVTIILDILKLIRKIGKGNRQVLILCESESHHYSKLIGECDHFQETGEVLDFGEVKVNGAIISGSLLEYFHRVWKLIDIKDELKTHKNKELIKNEVNQDGYIRLVTEGYLHLQ